MPNIQKRSDALIEQYIAAAQSEYSISGRLGHFMEPAIRPLGYDWKMGVGLVSAFAAREVFISSMGIVYSVGKVEDDTADLSSAMRNDVYPSGPNAGKPVWTPHRRHQPARLVRAGDAVHEHLRRRPQRDWRLDLAYRYVGLHERAGVCREPDRVSGWLETFCVGSASADA